MPQSLGCVLVHLVFSTKDRSPWLRHDVRPRLHGYLAAIVRSAGCACHRVGGIDDHVHVAVGLSRTASVAELVGELKTRSSRWLKTSSPGLHGFAWQRGYGVFSVGPRHLGALVEYIDAQEAHHRGRSFEDEYRALLGAYGVEFDERYVWD